MKKRKSTPAWFKRSWTNLRETFGASEAETLKCAGSRFRVLNWNVLAPSLVDFKYRDVSPHLLDWSYRQEVIIDEIYRSEADIITLQEVEPQGYRGFKHAFRGGYDGYYAQKSTRQDGVATFWRNSAFKLEEAQAIRFDRGGILDRPQVATIVALRQIASGELLMVANTHLLFNTKRGDVKLGQLLCLLSAMWQTVLRKAENRLDLALDHHLIPHEWQPAGQGSSALSAESSSLSPPARSPRKGRTQSQSLTNNTKRGTEEKGKKGKKGKKRKSGQQGAKPLFRLLRKPPAVLLCGDFNLIPSSDLYNYLHTGRHDFACHDAELFRKSISGQHIMEDRRLQYPVDPQGHKGCGATGPLPQLSNFGSLNRSVFAGQSGYIRVERRQDDQEMPTANVSLCAPNSSTAAPCWLRELLQCFTTLHHCGAPEHKWLWLEQQSSSTASLPTTAAGMTTATSNYEAMAPFSNLRRTELCHPLLLRSAYATAHPIHGKPCEPAFTAFHGWQKGCVDYIWFSESELQVTGVLELPSLTALRKLDSIPHPVFPGSDHFNLVADLEWRPERQRKHLLIEAQPA